jgi:hypothetical protein
MEEEQLEDKSEEECNEDEYHKNDNDERYFSTVSVYCSNFNVGRPILSPPLCNADNAQSVPKK